MWASLASFVVSIFAWLDFDNSMAGFQFVEKVDWIPSLGIQYYVGIDGISLFFVILSTFFDPSLRSGKLGNNKVECPRVHDSLFGA